MLPLSLLKPLSSLEWKDAFPLPLFWKRVERWEEPAPVVKERLRVMEEPVVSEPLEVKGLEPALACGCGWLVDFLMVGAETRAEGGSRMAWLKSTVFTLEDMLVQVLRVSWEEATCDDLAEEEDCGTGTLEAEVEALAWEAAAGLAARTCRKSRE